ncbi:conserved hypothetical protein [Trichinella spiralis]|uniref:hypothetical protein n=1 Tax=Trichinella spiralis TaxID=6334 RepID=UPI0001EFE41E|nr:conserved hypothetical protein [Trichinella spiralis]
MSIEEKLKGLAGESTAAVSSACSPKLSKYSAVSKFSKEIQKDKKIKHDIDENRISEMTDLNLRGETQLKEHALLKQYQHRIWRFHKFVGIAGKLQRRSDSRHGFQEVGSGEEDC